MLKNHQNNFIKLAMISSRSWLKRGVLLAIAIGMVSFFEVVDSSAQEKRQRQEKQAQKEEPTPLSKYGKLTSQRWAFGMPYKRTNLVPVNNPHPKPEPQPYRDHPFDLAITADGRKVYVGLQGSELEPGNEVAIYDVVRRKVTKRIPLKIKDGAGSAGLSPYRLTLHPGGRFILVTNRFSNFASVIDTKIDSVVSEVPLDFYCQGVAFTQNGQTAYIANRYLDQCFVLDVAAAGERFSATMRELGGLDYKAFIGNNVLNEQTGGIHKLLTSRCGDCHIDPKSGFIATNDSLVTFLSALPHIQLGNAKESRLLRAVVSQNFGGYADILPKIKSHNMGTVVFQIPEVDPDYKKIADWINAASEGPGIPVGNPRSKPKICTLTTDGRFLLVGNTGTQDISIVDTRLNREVGAIYIQNVVNDLKIYHHKATGEDYLLVSTLGAGFGVTNERDPYGGESLDRANKAAHFSVWRDLDTGYVLPKDKQAVLGPYHAVDGTAGIKFRDIQNDIIILNLAKLDIPENSPEGNLEHLLLANRYEAHKGWVRYTSDTAESTNGDVKGDIPPDLMRVVGAFPEKMVVIDDQLFVTMQGSNEVQRWKINPDASEPSDYLLPIDVYPTGMQPIGIVAGPKGTPADGKLFVANFLGGSISVIDTIKGNSQEVIVDPSILRRPLPDTNSERGEIFAHTSLFSSDGDTSCFHCHYLDMGDGRPWGVSQVVGQEYLTENQKAGNLIIGGTMGVPQMRGLFQIQPFFYEGVISAFEPRSMIMEHAPADDYHRPLPRMYDLTWIKAHYQLTGADDVQSGMDSSTSFQSDLEERRDEMYRQLSMKYFGKAFNLRDFQRFVGEWQIAEPHLLPNPYDQTNQSVLRGRELFFHPQMGCASCHPPPAFAKKNLKNNREQALDALVTFTARDGSFTLIGMNRLDSINKTQRDLEVWDAGRTEKKQGKITISQLRGIWDRPPVFLHNGLARTLREVVATPGHIALRKFKYMPLLAGIPERPERSEIGFNETFWYSERSKMAELQFSSGARLGIDTHGGTSHLNGQQIDDIVNFLQSIE